MKSVLVTCMLCMDIVWIHRILMQWIIPLCLIGLNSIFVSVCSIHLWHVNDIHLFYLAFLMCPSPDIFLSLLKNKCLSRRDRNGNACVISLKHILLKHSSLPSPTLIFTFPSDKICSGKHQATSLSIWTGQLHN